MIRSRDSLSAELLVPLRDDWQALRGDRELEVVTLGLVNRLGVGRKREKHRKSLFLAWYLGMYTERARLGQKGIGSGKMFGLSVPVTGLRTRLSVGAQKEGHRFAEL